MNQDILDTRIDNLIDMFFLNDSLTVDNYLITLDRNNLTGIFINEIFNPSFQYTCSQLAAYYLLKICLIHLNIFCQVKNLKNIFIIFEAYRSQQRCYRQFFLSIDVCVHHIIDVGSKLNP